MSILPDPEAVVAANAASHLTHDRRVIRLKSPNDLAEPAKRPDRVQSCESMGSHFRMPTVSFCMVVA